MNHTFTEKYIKRAITESVYRSAAMKFAANGETLETKAEDAYHEFLKRLDVRIKAQGGGKIVLELREVFIAGYRASEERDWT